MVLIDPPTFWATSAMRAGKSSGRDFIELFIRLATSARITLQKGGAVMGYTLWHANSTADGKPPVRTQQNP
jgi:hypothetical protein